jgi:hypothetical protein
VKLCLGVLAVASTLAIVACQTPQNGKPGADGVNGIPGHEGPAAESPSSSVAINLIEPRVGLVDRTVDVTVSLDGKIDIGKATADFGDGVTVKKIGRNGNALVATLEIAPTAKLGKHDVMVSFQNEAGLEEQLLARNAFVVAVPLYSKLAGGKAEQGGLVRLAISNRDKIWFNTDKFTLFPLSKKGDASLVALAHQGFTATDGTVIFLGDPLAKTGPLGFLGFNDPDDDNSASYLTEPDAVSVASRAPTPLIAGTPIEKTFANDLETGLYSAEATPGAASEGVLVDAWAKVPTGSTMSPMILAYPKSGMAADLIGQGKNDPGYPSFGIPATEARVAFPVMGATASTSYFVVVDANLGHGPTTKLSLSYNATRGTLVAEKPIDHATGATAQNIGSLPNTTTAVAARIINGELKAADEVDVYKFSGLSATLSTDMLVSVISDAEVTISVDTVPTFDGPNLVEIHQGGSAGMGTTSEWVGAERYIRVTAKPDAGKPTGKYSLGVKRIATVSTR